MVDESEEVLRYLREMVTTYVFGWSGPHYDNKQNNFWWDDKDKDKDYKEHPGAKLTFDECLIAIRTKYKKEQPLENYTLEEFILSRIEDNSDK